MSPGIMFFLGGVSIGAVMLIVVFRHRILGQLYYQSQIYLSKTINQRVLATKQLVVEQKFEVPAESFTTAIDLWLDAYTPVGMISRKYPEEDLCVIRTSVKVLGPVYFPLLAVAVDRKTYLEVAQGDKIDNPHFGKFNPDAWVDPEIVLAYTSRPQ